MDFAALFPVSQPLIGMVHLPPLPGSPRYEGDFELVRRRALTDAATLAAGGMDGLLIENFHDAPFRKQDVEPHTMIAMALLVREIVQAVELPCGVNVLRNDARAALALAHLCGAAFIRVNVHVGAMVTDQGVIEGNAYETLRYRRELGANVALLADVFVKHAVPLAPLDLDQMARDTVYRGLADGLIVSGSGTGITCDLNEVQRVRNAVPQVPLLVGSGVAADNVGEFLRVADGVIVGTSLKCRGEVSQPVDLERVRALVRAARAAAGARGEAAQR